MTKYYTKCDKLWLMDDECQLLAGVDSNLCGRGSMRLNSWGKGWIFEADSEFALYTTLRSGNHLVLIYDDEYRELKHYGVVFFSKERTNQLRLVIDFDIERYRF
jgi:hypothetical protein